MTNRTMTPPPRRDGALERKIARSKWALFFERLWPRAWCLIALAGLFLVISLAGAWRALPALAHQGGLALFALGALASLVYMIRTPWPTREEALRRLEVLSGVPHRPATSYEDTYTPSRATDPAALAVWGAHKARLARLIEKLRVARPAPRVDRRDPWAVRGALMLALLVLGIVVGDSASDRIHSAFRFGPTEIRIPARLDAWVTPPVYTGRPPVMLADGARQTPEHQGTVIEIPDRSALVIRASGSGHQRYVVELAPEGGEVVPLARVGADGGTPVQNVALEAAISEFRADLRKSGTLRVLDGTREVARWRFQVTPDLLPKIALTKDPERTARGGLKLAYKVEDDYGVASAEVRFERVQPPGEETEVSGPRPPHERPPLLELRLPKANPKMAEGSSFHELADHPWAGLRVRMTLIARDLAGQVGKSEPIELTLPQRRFRKPLARSLIEERRHLSADPRLQGRVVYALESIAYEPEAFDMETPVYLGLRTVISRLKGDRTRVARKSAIDQLWHIALKVEDGDLSEAERNLREIQDKLSKAIQDGASPEEIQKLMQELREALAQFLEQMMRQADQNQMREMPGQSQMQQYMNSRDLDQMLRNLENMARSGDRDMAQQMLSELRDLLERMQSGRMANNGEMNEMMQMMDQLGDIIGKEQQLLDDTFGEQRRQGERGQQGQQRGQQQGRQGQQQGRQGQRQPGQRGQRGERGQQGQEGQDGQQGEEGQEGQDGEGRDGQGRPGGLARRQGELRDRLGQLRDRMRQFGMRSPGQLDAAEEAMERARRALEQGDLDRAAEEEARALDQLRQGAQQMAQQMLRAMPSRVGDQGGPRDPLGRPQRTDIPDTGNVKVPDEIDAQRAREILEELRRRLGDQTRPSLELDYIERLLKRF